MHDESIYPWTFSLNDTFRWKVIKRFCIVISLALTCSMAIAQEKDTVSHSRWNYKLENYFYIYKDDFFVLPIFQVNKDWLHLEARYNYENMNTGSAWFGYNFTGGNKLQYTITPMVAGILGKTNGIAPGLEVTLDFFGFEFYTEAEYVFDLQTRDDFFYDWTIFTYSPLDWLFFGLASQWKKGYGTDLDIQPGFLVGGGYRWFGLTGYIYNLGFDDPYGIVTLTLKFPD